jgi:hypothetical protein
VHTFVVHLPPAATHVGSHPATEPPDEEDAPPLLPPKTSPPESSPAPAPPEPDPPDDAPPASSPPLFDAEEKVPEWPPHAAAKTTAASTAVAFFFKLKVIELVPYLA